MSSLNERRKRKGEINGHASTGRVKKLKCDLIKTNGDAPVFEVNKLKCGLTNGNTHTRMGDTSENGVETIESFPTKLTKSSECKLEEGEYFCFACKEKDVALTKCSIESCDKMYHSKCLEKLPTIKSEVNVCPHHVCLTCYNINAKNAFISKGEMYKCFKCPTAFHKKDECCIPGSVTFADDIMSCPDHFTPEIQRKYPSVIHLTFCIQCGSNEDLIFCRFCPVAIHIKCKKGKSTTGEQFVCDRCDSRKTVNYNDIVWVKICDFRWWPARIVNPKDLPISVQTFNHFEGEFPVQFFKTEEYFWVNTGRVYPFVCKQIGIEDEVKHNFKKILPDVDFDEAVNLAISALQMKKVSIKSADPVNTNKPPPYKHIKSNRPIGNVQIYTCLEESDCNTCGCNTTDENPCGYDTICLNRNMLQECHDGICGMGDLCQNRKFVKVENAACMPFYTPVNSWGLKSVADIKKGQFVIEYVGDLIDEEECQLRIKHKQAVGDTNFYFCTLDSNRIIDAGPKGNFSRFMNHSCDPNCEMQKWLIKGDPRVGLFAKEDIKAGAELTFDYQMDFSHFEKLKCRCGSARCVGFIGMKVHNGSRSSQARPDEDTVLKEHDMKLTNGSKEGDLNSSSKKKPLNIIKKAIDNNVKVNAIVKIDGVKVMCFKCKIGGRLIKCSREDCGKFFHGRCLKDGKNISENWVCPCHFCIKCKSESVYRCEECPKAYCQTHAGSKNNNKKFSCPKHR